MLKDQEEQIERMENRRIYFMSDLPNAQQAVKDKRIEADKKQQKEMEKLNEKFMFCTFRLEMKY